MMGVDDRNGRRTRHPGIGLSYQLLDYVRQLTHRVGEHLSNRISVSWGGAERSHQGFEVLCGDYSCIEWVRIGKGQPASFPNRQPVEGGREKDGRGLLIARVEHGGGVHSGSEYGQAVGAAPSSVLLAAWRVTQLGVRYELTMRRGAGGLAVGLPLIRWQGGALRRVRGRGVRRPQQAISH